MGQRTIENSAVIDETFAGVSMPSQVHELGRPDIKDERPGATLVEAVREFERDGGFRAISDDRNEKREAAEAAEKAVIRGNLPEISLDLPTEGAKKELAEE